MIKVKQFISRVMRKLNKNSYNNRIIVKSVKKKYSVINIFGYFDYIFSISSNARDFVTIAGLDGGSANLVPLLLVGKTVCEDNYLVDNYSLPSHVAQTNLWFVNFDLINDCYRRHRQWFSGRYNIAVFWWEFADYFPNVKCFDFLDEIVVFSSITYDAVHKVIPTRVKLTKLEYPFIIKKPITEPSEILAKYNLSANLTNVLFVFDVHSHMERKNPHGVLQAFKIAVVQNSILHLVLKITNFELWRNECLELLSTIEKLGLKNQVTIISDSLTDTHMRDLIGACDIYISLHHAEGLGLGMLEAMSLGKPVISTRFGGNLDFMNDGNSLLVDYTLIEVQKSFATYKKGYLWADPDVSMAAKHLLELSTNNDLYAEISTKAKESIRIQYDALKLQTQCQNILNIK